MSKELDLEILDDIEDNENEERYLRGDLEKFVMEKVDSCRMFNGHVDWSQMVYLAEKEFGDEFTKEKIRSIYRKHSDPEFTANVNERVKQSRERKLGKITLRDQIITRIKNKCSVDYLFDTISHPDDEILAEITRMELDGYIVNKWNEFGEAFLQLSKDKYQDVQIKIDLDVKETISIAVVGDTHFGHQQSKINEFKSFIEFAYNKGVRDVIHTGDITEGSYITIRPTSVKELDAVGFDEQIDLANMSMPKKDGLKYYVISGNHDATYDRNAYANPAKMLSRMRDDIVYLGHNFGKITINDGTDIGIVHPTDGIGQNYGLKLHQYIDRASDEKQARIILMGHYHKHAHIHYKGVDGFITPAFVGQSNFMKDNNLRSVVGGMIMHLSFNKDKELISMLPEYVWFD
jgi:predicted phosphodiesterase